MLDLVSVFTGTVRTEDLPGTTWEAWFVSPAERASTADGPRPRPVRTAARFGRRGWLFCGICAVVAGTTLLKRA